MSLEIPANRIQAITKIVHLPNDVAEELAKAFRAASFSQQPTEMVNQIKGSVAGIPLEDLSDIVEALYELYYVREFSGVSTSRFLADLTNGVKRTLGTSLTPQLLAAAKDRLKGLLDIDTLKDLSKGIGLQREEERLYCEARIISDIRPVFSKDPKARPIGAALSHTLKITYHEGREHKDFFVVLDKSDLSALKNVIERAHNKAGTLSTLLKESNLPDLGM